LDIDQNANATGAFMAGGKPKTLVMIPGANHFGYTDICPENNACSILLDENGTISREGQQQAAAAYLAALVRFFALGDETMRPFLAGERIIDGLDAFGVTGLQVQADGDPFGHVPPHVLPEVLQ